MDLGLSEYFMQDAGIAGVGNVFVDGVSEKIEKGLEQSVAEFLVACRVPSPIRFRNPITSSDVMDSSSRSPNSRLKMASRIS